MTTNGKQRQRAPVATSPCASAGSCPNCGGGELFLDLARDGTILVLCDRCTVFVPTAESSSADAPAEPEVDLPSVVRLLRPSERAVFRIVRDIPGLMPAGIVAEVEKRTNDFSSRFTVSHALKTLHRAGFVHRAEKGWVAGPKAGAQ
ncbi:unnamed protein product [Gemmata massiliana]|uniref:Uncharacterized protein n=1 Tax=Gemmata massiliana TaxID=1210884 RepID=A0A6P2DNT3_9BACT|nr:hypothetical protein [Gemmata massiliana]VTS03791.1 unnamed protein product [Gemmata massiliana]